MSLPWVVGVDGGGSRGRAWFARADHAASHIPLGVADQDGSCNPYTAGADTAGANILAVIDAARRAAGAPEAALQEAFVCIGTAGIERERERSGLEAVLGAAGIAAERLLLEGDPWVALEGALPAAEGRDRGRVMVIAGTGSVAVAVGPSGARRRAGGWGVRVGDEGSGAWLGIEAVRLCLRALDGRDPPGPLAAAVAAAWGETANALVGRARDATPAGFAQLAPLVLATSHDPEAQRLRARAVTHLSELVMAVVRGLSQQEAPQKWAIASTGGLAQALERDLKARLPEHLAHAWQAPHGPPVAGAWALAQRRALGGG